MIERYEYDRPEFAGADQLQGASIGGPLPKALIGREFKNIDFHDRFSNQKIRFWLPAPQSNSDSSGAPKYSIFWRVVWLGDAGFEFSRARFAPAPEGSKFNARNFEPFQFRAPEAFDPAECADLLFLLQRKGEK